MFTAAQIVEFGVNTYQLIAITAILVLIIILFIFKIKNKGNTTKK